VRGKKAKAPRSERGSCRTLGYLDLGTLAKHFQTIPQRRKVKVPRAKLRLAARSQVINGFERQEKLVGLVYFAVVADPKINELFQV
jgi:hypothetical protein